MLRISQPDPPVNGSGVPDIDNGISPALLAANARLYALREQHKQTNPRPKPIERVAAPSKERGQLSLPAHLGWGCARLTEQINRHAENQKETPSKIDVTSLVIVHAAEDPSERPPEPELESKLKASSPPAFVTAYPDIGAGMLKMECAAAGRIWLLCRYLDKVGRGWLNVSEIRTALTTKNADLRVCGWRRLRILFKEGEGLFWTRDDRGRLWLFSAEKVARNLNIERLTGRSIKLPITALLGGMRVVRAHLYAAFHSGRRSDKPISRTTLTMITGVQGRAQRTYDNLVGVKRKKCIAVGHKLTTHRTAKDEDELYRRGMASFVLVDKLGKQGEAGARYFAWQLPNRYVGIHETCCTGRQRKINRRLANDTDLVNQRAQGNGDSEQYQRLFYRPNERLRPNPLTDNYWLDNEKSCVWYLVPAQKRA